ncbi:hypothetical protein NL676_039901 [Syzygium grande]|nr:hypothetical protein NL676_039901 [Syzygium grande]
MVSVSVSDSKREGDMSDAVEGGNETVVSGESDLGVNSKSSSGTQKEDDFSIEERNGDEGMELKVDRSDAVVEAGHDIESGRPLTIDFNRPKSMNSSMEGGLRENPANLTRYSSWPIETSRISSHEYVSDGSLNHQPCSYFEHSKSAKSNVHINGLNRGESLDLDAELLRKSDDLKNHISRISDAPERTGEMAFLDREGLPEPFDDKFNKYEQGSSLDPSSHSSEEEDVPNEVKLGTNSSTSAEKPLLWEEPPTVPSLTFTKNLDNSSSKLSEDQYAEESEIKEIRRDFLVQKGVPRQKSVQDTATEDEIKYLLNDCLNTSQDSSDASKEADRLKTKKRDNFFFLSFIKKSIGDFSRSNEIVEIAKPNVVINGHPIPNHLVKKAEKLAGLIRPGNYWYDFQGGFWGVMGRTCLGIIPPFIEEFNYPMPANCAAGNMGIFVSGRELHQKDLELLTSRGLPRAPNRFYKIKISGSVWHEKYGEKLCRLGKLAPTEQSVDLACASPGNEEKILWTRTTEMSFRFINFFDSFLLLLDVLPGAIASQLELLNLKGSGG